MSLPLFSALLGVSVYGYVRVQESEVQYSCRFRRKFWSSQGFIVLCCFGVGILVGVGVWGWVGGVRE